LLVKFLINLGLTHRRLLGLAERACLLAKPKVIAFEPVPKSGSGQFLRYFPAVLFVVRQVRLIKLSFKIQNRTGLKPKTGLLA